MKFFLFVLSSTCIPFTLEQCLKPMPEEQPGCRHNIHATTFYENHACNLNVDSSKNWICHQKFDELLKYCFTVYKIMSSRKVETEYKIVRDAESVEKGCTARSMTFWLPDDSSTEPNKPKSLNLNDVRMFYCPLTRMDLKFPKSEEPHEVRDFYITEGRNEGTIAVLRNSTSDSNVCLTNMYRPEDDFVEEIWFSNSEDLSFKGNVRIQPADAQFYKYQKKNSNTYGQIPLSLHDEKIKELREENKILKTQLFQDMQFAEQGEGPIDVLIGCDCVLHFFGPETKVKVAPDIYILNTVFGKMVSDASDKNQKYPSASFLSVNGIRNELKQFWDV